MYNSFWVDDNLQFLDSNIEQLYGLEQIASMVCIYQQMDEKDTTCQAFSAAMFLILKAES